MMHGMRVAGQTGSSWVYAMAVVNRAYCLKHKCTTSFGGGPWFFNVVNEGGEILSRHKSRAAAQQALARRVRLCDAEFERYG